MARDEERAPRRAPRTIRARPVAFGRGPFGVVALLLPTLLGAGATHPADSPSPCVDRLTLLGGSGEEEVTDVAVGADGSVYVAGWTASADFPVTEGAADVSLGGERDAFVARLSPGLDRLLAATLLGGESELAGKPGAWDVAYALAVSERGVYVAGFTSAPDFPTTGSLGVPAPTTGSAATGTPEKDAVPSTRPGAQGTAAFVARLSPDLGRLERSVVFGGSGTDLVYDLELSAAGDVYVTGFTLAADFPTTEGAADRRGSPAADTFVSRLDADLSTLVASTLLARSSAQALALAPDGRVFVGGVTDTTAFATTDRAFDRSCGSDGRCNTDGFGRSYADGFVARFDPGLGMLEASTYLGGLGEDGVEALSVDTAGRVWAVGSTGSPDFPTTPAAYLSAGRSRRWIFATRLDAGLTGIEASTLLGGSGPFGVTEGFAALVGDDGLWLVGETFVSEFPTTAGASRRTLEGGNEAVLAHFDPTLGRLVYATFLGGPGGALPEEDQGRALTRSPSGTLYWAGRSASPGLRGSEGALQPTPAGHFDGFVACGPAAD